MSFVIPIVIILSIILLVNIVKFSIKVASFVILAVVLGLSVWICVQKPDMHKQFSVNIIEYLMKINKDGSVTTTKQVTQTVVDKK